MFLTLVLCTLWTVDELAPEFHWPEGNNWIVGWRELVLDSTVWVPLKLEMEPLPVLVWASALKSGLFPKLTAVTSLTQSPLYFLCTCQGETPAEKWEEKRVGDEDVIWKPLCVAPGCRRAFEGVWGGIYGNRPQINCNYRGCGVTICLCLEPLRGKNM